MSSHDPTPLKPASDQDFSLEVAVRSTSTEVLLSASSDAALSEELALALLSRGDLPTEVLDRLSRNAAVMKSRKVKLALLQHPKTPRHVSLPMIRHLFTFDLMQVALTPVVAADLKAAADEALIHRLEKISAGEKLSLARRASGRVAGELLRDGDARVMQAALENSHLTEAAVAKAIVRPTAASNFIEAVANHGKWSLRQEIRMALLRNAHTPPARAAEFAGSLPPRVLKEMLEASELPEEVKEKLQRGVAGQGG
jgi:hypothetical protein